MNLFFKKAIAKLQSLLLFIKQENVHHKSDTRNFDSKSILLHECNYNNFYAICK